MFPFHPLKSFQHMVLTVNLAGVLTRRSVTGNMTTKCNSSGVCWPAKQDLSRITQVMQSSLWPHFFELEVSLWRVSEMWEFRWLENAADHLLRPLFSGISQNLFPSRDILRPIGRKCWLNLATDWPPWEIAHWAKICELIPVLYFFWAFLMKKINIFKRRKEIVKQNLHVYTPTPTIIKS